MLFGLLTALAWGIADLTAALVGRRIGGLWTVLIAQVSSLLLLAAALAITGASIALPPTDIAILLVNGILGAVAYIGLYRGLELGPVALVSPIIAAYSGLTILLAFVLLGERMSTPALLGTIAPLVGVLLASTDLRALRGGGKRLAGPGIPWAIMAMLLFGVATFVLGRYAHESGWAGPTFYSRLGDVVAIGVILTIWRRKMGRRPVSRWVYAAVGVGIADMLGVIFYALGSRVASVSIVTAASVAFILIPVLGGLAIFRERPSPSQLAGVGLVATGLLLLALGS